MRRVVFRRDDLQDPKAIAAIGDEGKNAASNHAKFNVVHIVELTVCREGLVELWRFWPFGVNDCDSLLTGGNISVSARDIDVAGVLKRHQRVWNRSWFGKVGHVEHF